MSYTEEYQGTVHYSGTKHYTYPPSKYGGSGSVHYSGNIPVNITVHVDTSPFDSSVDGTRRALSGVAGVLSATEAAQVAAISEGSQRIAKKTIDGFFGLLGSELSSQISEFGSAMKSSMGLLMEQSQGITRIHGQMEGDFQRIKGHYVGIFDRLDQELERRIKALDHDAFSLREQVTQSVVEPYTQGASVMYSQAEHAHAVPIKVNSARIKHFASKALDSLGDACRTITDYAGTVTQVTDNREGEGPVFVPVVFTQRKQLAGDAEQITVHQAGTVSADAVRSEVIRFVSSVPDSRWVEVSGKEKEALDFDFLRCVEEYGRQPVDGEERDPNRERVCQLIMSMYEQSHAQTTYTEQQTESVRTGQ